MDADGPRVIYHQPKLYDDSASEGQSNMETDSCCDSSRQRTNDDSSDTNSVLSFNSERDTSVFLRDYGGRTFNSQNDLYFLPADEPEFDRLDKQHLMLLLALPGLYAAPEAVRRAVAPEDGVQKAILDLGTGGGTWAMAMANEFPHCEVVGVDLAPSTSRPPPPNCRFEFDDINLGLPHYHGCFDVVHARSCANGIKDYAAFVDEIALCLRPGGVALFTEGDFNLCDEFKKPIESAREGDEDGKSWFRRLLFEVYELMESRGTSVVGGLIVDHGLGDHWAFEQTGTKELFTCIGPWEVGETPEHTRQLNIIGTLMRQNSLEFTRAWRPLLLSADYSPETIDDWIHKIDIELNTVSPPMYCRWRYCWGVKRDIPAPAALGANSWPSSVFNQIGMPKTFRMPAHDDDSGTEDEGNVTATDKGEGPSRLKQSKPIAWEKSKYRPPLPDEEDDEPSSEAYRLSSPGAQSTRSGAASLTWEMEQQALQDSKNVLLQYYSHGKPYKSHDGSICPSPMEHKRAPGPPKMLPSMPGEKNSGGSVRSGRSDRSSSKQSVDKGKAPLLEKPKTLEQQLMPPPPSPSAPKPHQSKSRSGKKSSPKSSIHPPTSPIASTSQVASKPSSLPAPPSSSSSSSAAAAPAPPPYDPNSSAQRKRRRQNSDSPPPHGRAHIPYRAGSPPTFQEAPPVFRGSPPYPYRAPTDLRGGPELAPDAFPDMWPDLDLDRNTDADADEDLSYQDDMDDDDLDAGVGAVNPEYVDDEDADEFAYDPQSHSTHGYFPSALTLSSLPPLPPPPPQDGSQHRPSSQAQSQSARGRSHPPQHQASSSSHHQHRTSASPPPRHPHLHHPSPSSSSRHNYYYHDHAGASQAGSGSVASALTPPPPDDPIPPQIPGPPLLAPPAQDPHTEDDDPAAYYSWLPKIEPEGDTRGWD